MFWCYLPLKEESIHIFNGYIDFLSITNYPTIHKKIKFQIYILNSQNLSPLLIQNKNQINMTLTTNDIAWVNSRWCWTSKFCINLTTVHLDIHFEIFLENVTCSFFFKNVLQQSIELYKCTYQKSITFNQNSVKIPNW